MSPMRDVTLEVTVTRTSGPLFERRPRQGKHREQWERDLNPLEVTIPHAL